MHAHATTARSIGIRLGLLSRRGRPKQANALSVAKDRTKFKRCSRKTDLVLEIDILNATMKMMNESKTSHISHQD